MTIRVEPDGPCPNDLVVCGESPGADEVAEGRGFVGRSGRMLWGEQDLVGGIVGRPRDSVWVTNVCKIPMPEPQWLKLSVAERLEHINELMSELDRVNPRVVLAFGSRASSILAGTQYISKEQGKPKLIGDRIILPLWHPAAFLRGNAKVLGDLAIALAMVPDLLQNGIKVDPVDVGLPKSTDEFLGLTLERVAFMKRATVKKNCRCLLCGSKPAVTYEASFCDAHAIATEQWLANDR